MVLSRLRAVVLAVTVMPLLGAGCTPALEEPDRFCQPGFDVERDLFRARCAQSGCHGAGPSPAGGLDLASPDVAARLVQVPSAACGGLRIDPEQPAASLLLDKISGEPACGFRMPLGAPPLAPGEVQCVREWVHETIGAGVGSVDAGPGAPDANPGAPDGTPAPDAMPRAPDATPPGPDAMPPAPDAMPPAPDAMPPAPDAAQPGTGILIVEVYYDHPGTDTGYEWIKLYNDSAAAVDLSGYSLGYGGGDYTYGGISLAGVLGAHQCAVIGGPLGDADNGAPSYFSPVDLDPDVQNSGATADGIALFDRPANEVDATTVPIDTVVYGGANTSGLVDAGGAVSPVDVDDGPDGSSLRRAGATWVIATPPTPHACP